MKEVFSEGSFGKRNEPACSSSSDYSLESLCDELYGSESAGEEKKSTDKIQEPPTPTFPPAKKEKKKSTDKIQEPPTPTFPPGKKENRPW